ncbi:LysR family transcriptional regulator [Marinimicrobium locisalis]|uniref:LysR family transcriptional regulator n=1 Tax=Marinimicrobium locisalis TaxID=546022 RepID=UPI0032216EEC
MNIRHLSFRLLEVYITVIRTGSISAAARQLHLTQPTVSLQIKKLTETVGEPLLSPKDNRWEMTDVGAELYRAACDVLGRFEDFGQTLAEAREGRWGQVRLGVVSTATYVVPQILGGFYRSFPAVDVKLTIGNRGRILERFSAQEDDLYIFSHPPSGPAVRAASILHNPLELVAPSDHWSKGHKTLEFETLTNERFLIREPGSATRMAFETWLSAKGLEIHNSLPMESNEAIRLSVGAGLGLAVLSTHTLPPTDDRFARLSVKGFPLESNWYLVASRDRRLSQAARSLVRFIDQSLARCVDARWLNLDHERLKAFTGLETF